MAHIKQLDQNTINKIAAGEVIERPCAVVKELVENAIDAKSNAITIEIKDGGISLIRITDNGCGINEDDIETAFLRHATSKIKSIEDLFSVTSLGFRGEALSSIAAVAQVELITKETNELMGTRYVIEGGKEICKESIGCPEGTTFIVRNIFYNTPVRRKFLKTPSTEAAHISDFVEKLAISHPDISFKFISNGQIKLNTSGNGKQKDIIYNVYGREITSNTIEVNNHSIDISVTGYIGKAVISRGNRNLENYFINGRYIKSSVINKAIEEAYKPFMMVHKYPFTLLNINIDSGQIDVNVHPTKMEIRFMNSSEVYAYIYHTVKDALESINMIPEVELSAEKKQGINNNGKNEHVKPSAPEPFEVKRRVSMGYTNSASIKSGDNGVSVDGKEVEDNNIVSNSKTNNSFKHNENYRYDKDGFDKDRFDNKYSNKVKEEVKDTEIGILKETVNDSTNQLMSKINSLRDNSFVKDSISIKERNENIEKIYDREFKNNFDINNKKYENHKIESSNSLGQNKENNKVKEYNNIKVDKQVSLFDKENDSYVEKKNDIRIVGQVFLTYWIIEFEGKMYIIDQHAAHEKVMYEKFMKDLKDKNIVSQMIAPPIIVTLNMKEEEYLKENMEVFNELGFEIESFGGRDYSISALPANLPGNINKDFFLDLLDNLMDGSTTKSDILLEKVASMSCKAAVKGNNKMSFLEVKALIEELFTLDNPFNCPHGRPTTIAITKDELEKKFKRQV